MKNKKMLYIAFAIPVLLLILSQIFVLRNSKSSIPEEIMTSLDSKNLQNVILYNSFIFAMANEGIKFEETQTMIPEKEEAVFQINNHESFFVIYFPLLEDVCSSCIDFAINSVRDHFDDFSSSDRFLVIAQGKNPYLNSRIIKKHLYENYPGTFLEHIKYNSEKKPFYFVLNKNMEASMFFIPSYNMPELTKRYLDIISKKI